VFMTSRIVCGLILCLFASLALSLPVEELDQKASQDQLDVEDGVEDPIISVFNQETIQGNGCGRNNNADRPGCPKYRRRRATAAPRPPPTLAPKRNCGTVHSTGRWEICAACGSSTEGGSVSFMEGVTIENGVSRGTEISTGIETSIMAGFKVFGVKGEVTVSASVSTAISTEVSSAVSRTTETTVTHNIGPGTAWQFIFDAVDSCGNRQVKLKALATTRGSYETPCCIPNCFHNNKQAGQTSCGCGPPLCDYTHPPTRPPTMPTPAPVNPTPAPVAPPTPAPVVPTPAPRQAPGTPCWNQCGRKDGPCADFCGPEGRCCRNKGWGRDAAGCEGFSRPYNLFGHACSFPGGEEEATAAETTGELQYH